MIDLDNSGHVAFGTPGADGVEFPPEGALCTVLCKWKGGAKIEKAKASGKGGSKQTFTGTRVAEADITIGWADVEPSASLMLAAITLISPHGANKGKAWDFTERFMGLYDVDAVMVEEMEGPDPVKGSDEMTLKIKLSGWTKPSNTGVGVGATPLSATKFAVDGGALGAAGVVFHGQSAAELINQQQQLQDAQQLQSQVQSVLKNVLSNLPKVNP